MSLRSLKNVSPMSIRFFALMELSQGRHRGGLSIKMFRDAPGRWLRKKVQSTKRFCIIRRCSEVLIAVHCAITQMRLTGDVDVHGSRNTQHIQGVLKGFGFLKVSWQTYNHWIFFFLLKIPSQIFLNLQH